MLVRLVMTGNVKKVFKVPISNISARHGHFRGVRARARPLIHRYVLFLRHIANFAIRIGSLFRLFSCSLRRRDEWFINLLLNHYSKKLPVVSELVSSSLRAEVEEGISFTYSAVSRTFSRLQVFETWLEMATERPHLQRF